MAPDELLHLYPREALRFMRRLGLYQIDFARLVGVNPATAFSWESGVAPVRRPDMRRRLAALLKPHLATEAGETFVQTLRSSHAIGGCSAHGDHGRSWRTPST